MVTFKNYFSTYIGISYFLNSEDVNHIKKVKAQHNSSCDSKAKASW